MNRRKVLLSGAAAVAAASRWAPLRAASGPRAELVYVGMHGELIQAARFDSSTGALAMIGPVARNQRPTWGLRHPRRPVIYWNEESGNDGKSQGGVQAFQVDSRDGALTRIADRRAGGGGTTHLWFDLPSATILAANFGGGSVATLPAARDGSLEGISSIANFVGSGPGPRQNSPHAHGASIDPTGRWALVADLGSDRVWVLPFDRRKGTLGAYYPSSNTHFKSSPGSGPRHLAWHPNGHILYLALELTGEVAVLRWDPIQGQLAMIQSTSIDEAGFQGDKSVGEIAVSRDGRFVYASDRGDHTIVVHSVDPGTGVLTRIQRISSGGQWPWHFTITHPADGCWSPTATRTA